MNDDKLNESKQFEQLIQGLIDRGYGCCDDFLLPKTLTGLRANIATLNDSGKLKQAGVGNKMVFHEDKLVRSDKMNWIEHDSANTHEKEYLSKIWRFIHYLNNTCFASIKNFESHYASYGVGNFYKRHIDQFKTEKGRKYSVVLYLNQDWKQDDGGMLALYPKMAGQVNVLPIEGRMVFFRSDEMEHEVRPSTTRERRSIAGWLKN